MMSFSFFNGFAMDKTEIIIDICQERNIIELLMTYVNNGGEGKICQKATGQVRLEMDL